MKRSHVLRRRGSPPGPDHQSSADSVAGRMADCLFLSSRFRRAGPAASPRASDPVITCGERGRREEARARPMASGHGLHITRATRQHDRRRRAGGHAARSTLDPLLLRSLQVGTERT